MGKLAKYMYLCYENCSIIKVARIIVEKTTFACQIMKIEY